MVINSQSSVKITSYALRRSKRKDNFVELFLENNFRPIHGTLFSKYNERLKSNDEI